MPVRWTIAAGLAGLCAAAFAAPAVALGVSLAARALQLAPRRAEVAGGMAASTVAVTLVISLAVAGLLAPSDWRARVLAAVLTMVSAVLLLFWLSFTFSDASPLATLGL